MRLNVNNKYGAINAIKTILACLIAYVLGNLQVYIFDFESKYIWMIVTILVVMSTQPNVGGVVSKAIMRFAGTFIGATASVLIILLNFNGVIDYILVLILLFIFIFIASVYPKYSYAGFLAALTTAIVNFNGDMSILMALTRVSEIMQGIAIALLVNRYVYPITAEVRIKDNYVESLEKLKELFNFLSYTDQNDYRKALDSVMALYIKQTVLLKELAFEKDDISHYRNLHHSFMRIYRYTGAIRDYVNVLAIGNKMTFEKEELRFQGRCKDILSFFAESIIANDKIAIRNMNDFNKYLAKIIEETDEDFSYDDNVIINNYLKIFQQAIQDFYTEYNLLISNK